MENKNEMKNEKFNSWCLGIPVGAGIATLITLFITGYKIDAQKQLFQSQQITSLTSRDVNSDGLADIVVKQNSGDKIIYYNTGSEYLTAEQMEQREIQKIEQSYQEQLKKTNEFYKRAYDGNNVGDNE